VAKTYERIRNQRNDFLHKVANLYIERYGTIFVEDLNIIGLIRNSHLSKSISDSSWGKFFELLSYKAEEKVVKSLAVRIHSCPYCGLVMDRDENAARNILRVGQTRQALTKEVALCVA
jgi:putative transposase